MKALYLIFALFISLPAIAEQKEGNGGSGVAAEFVSVGYDLISRLDFSPIAEVSSKELRRVVEQTRIVVKPELVLDGNLVDAINYPSQMLIEVSSVRWEKTVAKPWLRLQIVFHEYLGILGVDDSSYRVSQKILSSDLCKRSDAMKSAVARELRRPCEVTTLIDLYYLKKLSMISVESLDPLDFKDLRNLEWLQVYTTSKLKLTPEFLAAMPTLTSLDITGSDVEIAPGTFENTVLNYVALGNARLAPGSLRGLSAKMFAIFGLPDDPVAMQMIKDEINRTAYSCGTVTSGSDPYQKQLVCLQD